MWLRESHFEYLFRWGCEAFNLLVVSRALFHPDRMFPYEAHLVKVSFLNLRFVYLPAKQTALYANGPKKERMTLRFSRISNVLYKPKY